MKDIKTTNTLLLIIVIPIVFYILKILSFIFIPLILSMFIALMFLPLMRWLKKQGVPKFISIFLVVLIIAGILKAGGELIQLSSKEILSADGVLFERVKLKLISFIISIEDFFGIQHIQGKQMIIQFFQKGSVLNNFGPTIDFIGDTISMTLMTVFFAILWLSESINFQKLLNNTILKQKYSSIKVFIKIEKDLIKFVIAKFIISLITGVCFTLACLLFNISFPIFWGLFAFSLNFIQVIGSVISVIALSLFALVELDPTGTLLLFIVVITCIQLIMGGILEPVFMGKSFSINIITILVMLMLWGFLWGVPGLIMSIPITVFLKIILEQYSSTKFIAGIMSGPEKSVLIPRKNRKNLK